MQSYIRFLMFQIHISLVFLLTLTTQSYFPSLFEIKTITLMTFYTFSPIYRNVTKGKIIFRWLIVNSL